MQLKGVTRHFEQTQNQYEEARDTYNRAESAHNLRLDRLGSEMADKDEQIKYLSEQVQTLQATLSQFKDKCFSLEQQANDYLQENQFLKE